MYNLTHFPGVISPDTRRSTPPGLGPRHQFPRGSPAFP